MAISNGSTPDNIVDAIVEKVLTKLDATASPLASEIRRHETIFKLGALEGYIAALEFSRQVARAAASATGPSSG